MTYDLSNPLHRKQFVRRANNMLKRQCSTVVLIDESKRTPNQNRYLHVLIRILALETGVKECYAKDVYFKQLANPDIFLQEAVDPITGEIIQSLRSSSELTVEEMTRAINNFRHWSEDNGYYLPEASVNDDGELEFASKFEEEAFKKAEMETNRASQFID